MSISNTIWFVLAIAHCAPTPKDVPAVEALEFMRKFGYVADDVDDSAALFTDYGLEQVIKEVQKFGAIEQTGRLDNATLALMRRPRCGVADVLRPKRAKRFVLGPKGWAKRNITYFIANWSAKLSEELVDQHISGGLAAWGQYGRLNFKRVYHTGADIIVAFGRGFHGDSYPFDGPGNILAHAFFPYEYEHLGGDIHFDDDELWSTDNASDRGTNFYQVAVHELGHSLGLAHSPVASSVMFPYYVGNGPKALDYDDILGMYELYIRRRLEEDDAYWTSSTLSSSTESSSPSTDSVSISSETSTYSQPPQTTTEPSTSQATQLHDVSSWSHYPTPSTRRYHPATREQSSTSSATPSSESPARPSFLDICVGRYDAIAALRNEIFAFKGEYLWRLRKEYSPVPGYPIPFRQMFPKLPRAVKRVDAAYQRPDGKIVLFSGKQYWVYDGSMFVESSPKALADLGLPGNLDRIDAVQHWARNSKTYFYVGHVFWRYNETAKRMDANYPKHMGRWRGVPTDLDAATTWNGVTYFFKGRCHWKFDNDWIRTTEASPLPTPQTWFGCPKEEIEDCYPKHASTATVYY